MGHKCFCRERSHRVFLHRSGPPGSECRGITYQPLCTLTKCTVVGTALNPTSAVGMQAVGLDVPQALCSQSPQHRYTKVRHQDVHSCTPGPTMRARESAQTTALLPHVGNMLVPACSQSLSRQSHAHCEHAENAAAMGGPCPSLHTCVNNGASMADPGCVLHTLPVVAQTKLLFLQAVLFPGLFAEACFSTLPLCAPADTRLGLQSAARWPRLSVLFSFCPSCCTLAAALLCEPLKLPICPTSSPSW